MDTWGAYHLHGKTGNFDWKIKGFAPSRLGRLQKIWAVFWGDATFSTLFSLFSWFGIYFVASRSPSTSNFILLCSCTKFPPNINTYFSLRAKFWRRRWVGRQFPRNVRWSEVEDQNKQTNKPGEDSNHYQKWPQCQQLVNSAQGLLLVCSARRWSMASP